MICGPLGWLGIHRSEKHLSYTVGIAIVWHSGLVDNQNHFGKKFNFGSLGFWAGWEYIALKYIYQSNTVVTAIAWHSGLVDDQNCSMWKKITTWISGLLGWLGIHRSEKHLSEQYCSHCYSMAQWVSGRPKLLCVKKIYNFGSVGLWAGWEYIGLRYIYQSNTAVTAIAWHSGLVDDQNCSVWKKKFTTLDLWASGLVGNT